MKMMIRFIIISAVLTVITSSVYAIYDASYVYYDGLATKNSCNPFIDPRCDSTTQSSYLPKIRWKVNSWDDLNDRIYSGFIS